MDQIKQFYDKKYRHGQKLAASTFLEHLHRKLQRWEYHRVTATLDLLSPGSTILDIGVGDGSILKGAAKKGYTQLFGVDISGEVLKTAKATLRSFSKSTTLLKKDICEGLPWKNSSFDTITMVAVLEHVFDVNQVLDEVTRLLKKNGTFIVEVPNVCFMPRRICFLLGFLPKTSDEPLYTDGHLQFFTYATLAKLLLSHGFQIEYAGCTGIATSWRNLAPTLLGANILMKARKV